MKGIQKLHQLTLMRSAWVVILGDLAFFAIAIVLPIFVAIGFIAASGIVNTNELMPVRTSVETIDFNEESKRDLCDFLTPEEAGKYLRVAHVTQKKDMSDLGTKNCVYLSEGVVETEVRSQIEITLIQGDSNEEIHEQFRNLEEVLPERFPGTKTALIADNSVMHMNIHLRTATPMPTIYLLGERDPEILRITLVKKDPELDDFLAISKIAGARFWNIPNY